MARSDPAGARWISVAAAARIIGVSRGYVRYLVDARRLSAKRVTFGIRLVEKCAAERFAQERAQRQAARAPRAAVAP